MNIAFLVRCLRYGVNESSHILILNLAKEMERNGHSVFIIAQNEDNLPRYEKIHDIPVYRTCHWKRLWVSPIKDWNKTSWYKDLFFVFKWILLYVSAIGYIQRRENIKFDIVHNFGAPIVSIRGILIKTFFRRIKNIHTLSAYSLSKFGRAGILFKLFNFVDGLSVTNKELYYMIKNSGCRKEIHLIRCNIDTDKFRQKNKLKLKRKYGFTGKKTILYYGHLNELKGVNYLIKSAKNVLKKNKNIKFVIAWSGLGNTQPYEKLINELNLQDFFNIIKHKVKIEDYVNIADMVVLPYTSLISTAGNPLCIFESLSCKTPVVTTKLKELEEVLKDGENVLLAKPKNPEDLAEKINMLLNSPKLREKISENGYLLSKQFSMKKIARDYIKLYEEVLENG